MSVITASELHSLKVTHQNSNIAHVTDEINKELERSLGIDEGDFFNITLDIPSSLTSLAIRLLKDAGYAVEDARTVTTGPNELSVKVRIGIPPQN